MCCCSLLIAGCSPPAISKDVFLSTFAGEYKNKSGTFTINSDSTYTSVWLLSAGDVSTVTGKIYLENENTTFYRVVNGNNGTEKLRYIPVVWGDRKYLFYSFIGYDIDSFCNGIADGTAVQRDDEGESLTIYSHTNNAGASVFGEPELINGEKFCK